MSDDQVKVLEHARRELEAVAGHESPHLLPLYQKFLKIENYRLRLRHQGGGGGREVCAEPRFVNRRSLTPHFYLRELLGDADNEGKNRPG
jgi:hypothetical protein